MQSKIGLQFWLALLYIDLAGSFSAADYLPKNDRTRYTISPEARKEVLKRLLLLNHRVHKVEMEKGLVKEKSKNSGQKELDLKN